MIAEVRLWNRTIGAVSMPAGRDVAAYRRDVLSRTLGMLKHAGLWQPPAETTRS